MSLPNDPASILDGFEVPGHRNWYSIGFGESRVTVFSQQVRALNLAWALRESGAVGVGPVIVIGGGAAGLSVAAGLAHGGVRVTVLERERELLPLQRNCSKRHLHPHIFDWPNELSENTRADLPLLDWRAGTASDVARAIESGFLDLVEVSDGQLDFCCCVQDIALDSPSVQTLNFWNAKSRSREHRPYKVVIFALGFGVEKSFWTGSRGSYWADDSLEQHGVVPEGRYLISGVGDGGLIDTFRLLLPELKQPDLARIVRSSTEMESLRKDIAAIDFDAKSAGAPLRASGNVLEAQATEGAVLWERYRNLAGLEQLDRDLLAQLNRKVHVTVLARGRSPFALSTQPLHRLLLSRLFFNAGDVLAVRSLALQEGMLQHEGAHVLLQTPAGSETFVHAIVRHGPEKLSAHAAFQELIAALAAPPKSVRADACYPPGFFGEGVAAFRGGGGPNEGDYLDELRGRMFLVTNAQGERIPLARFKAIAVELRELSLINDDELGFDSNGAEVAESTDEYRDPVDKARERVQAAREAEKEAKRRHNARIWDRRIGISVAPASVLAELKGDVFVLGEAGTGKTTFLKQIAQSALAQFDVGDLRSGSFPLLLASPPQLEVWGEDMVGALVECALISAEIANYSTAARQIRNRLASGKVIVLIDTVESWKPEVLREVIQWLIEHRVRFYAVGRSLPTSPAGLGLGTTRTVELVGIAPGSTRAFIETHLGERVGTAARASLQIAALKSIPNASAWRRTPFLLVEFMRAFDELAAASPIGMLHLYETRVGALAAKLDDATVKELERIAKKTLCARPSRFAFSMGEIESSLRTKVRSSRLLTGGQRLEFVHLTFGEYLASLGLSTDGLFGARRRLRGGDTAPVEPGEMRGELWLHQLEILPMAHATAIDRVKAAYRDSLAADPHQRGLALVLRSIGYGGVAVEEFCVTEGPSLAAEFVARLSLPSARFGEDERVLARYASRALPYLKRAGASAKGDEPDAGEPGAEGWAFRSFLAGSDLERRPPESVWWSTIYHEAQALVDSCASIDTVVESTRGGRDSSEIADALEALGEDGKRTLLLALDERARMDGFDRSANSDSPLGLLADPSARLRAWSARAALSSMADSAACGAVALALTNDPSASVQAEALPYLDANADFDRLLRKLEELTAPRTNIGYDEKGILTVLLRKLAGNTLADSIVSSFLERGGAWFCDAEQFEELLRSPANRAILQARLKTQSDLTAAEVEATRSFPDFQPAIRELVHTMLADGEHTHVLAAAIAALPKDDGASREARLSALELSSRPDEEERAVLTITQSAILSFEGDPAAETILQRFLQPDADPQLAETTLRVIGSSRDLRAIVWQIAKTTDREWNNAQFKAIEILCTDPAERASLKALFLEISSEPQPDPTWVTRDYFRARLLSAIASGEEPKWIEQYVSDADSPVREAAIEHLVGQGCSDEVLLRQAFKETSRKVRPLLWGRFANNHELRTELKARARGDLWALRQAYFSLLSEDEGRLAEMREYFRAAIARREGHNVLPELLRAIARDPDAKPELLTLIAGRDPRVVGTVLAVFRDDSGLRKVARALLKDQQWRSQFFLTSALEEYFADDVEAKQDVFELLQGAFNRGPVYLQTLGGVPVEILKGFTPARDLLKKIALLDDADINVVNAARGAVLDDSTVRARVIANLRGPDSNAAEVKFAARQLRGDFSVIRDLANLQSSSDSTVRKIAYRAAMRLTEQPPALLNLQEAEPEAQLRRMLIDGIDLFTYEPAERKRILHACIVSDYDWNVRISAGNKLQRAEPADALRHSEKLRSRIESRLLSEFLQGDRTVADSVEPELFTSVVAWVCAKLVSRLGTSKTVAARNQIDSQDYRFGEFLPGNGLDAELVLIRLAKDSFWLPRDRDIWPAANTLIAWAIAYRLVARSGKTILLCCGDLHSEELKAMAPRLKPGEATLGPTFFGFRLSEGRG